MTTTGSPPPVTTGPAAAALMSVGIGLGALGLSHFLSEASETVKGAMQALGHVWIPGAQGIGPYSGKETTALLVWLISWALLHTLLRKRDVSVVRAGIAALVLVGIATTILWPPVTHVLIKRIP